MTRPISANVPNQPAASLAEWARVVNGLAAQAREDSATAHGGGRPKQASRVVPSGRLPLLTRGMRPVGSAPIDAGSDRASDPAGDPAGDTASAAASNLAGASYRLTPAVAEHLVADGLDPGYLNSLATASGLEPRDVFEFAGIDRTTVSRRQVSGAALPLEAAVKALQATDLVTQAIEVFGLPATASAWLSTAHPLLNGQTPLQRARTPWGLGRVQSMLVALRYGSAA